jgi:hypothetical protein
MLDWNLWKNNTWWRHDMPTMQLSMLQANSVEILSNFAILDLAVTFCLSGKFFGSCCLKYWLNKKIKSILLTMQLLLEQFFHMRSNPKMRPADLILWAPPGGGWLDLGEIQSPNATSDDTRQVSEKPTYTKFRGMFGQFTLWDVFSNNDRSSPTMQKGAILEQHGLWAAHNPVEHPTTWVKGRSNYP